MSQGWIKLHRQLMEKGYANRPAYISLWVHLLMMANHIETEFMWNGSIIKIQPGQFLTGRKALSDRTGIPESSVEDILTFFEKGAQIRQQKTTKHRLITILNWDKHQISNNRATTEQQQADTNKNDNNINNLEGMSWKKYNEDGHYDEAAIDAETGEPLTPKGPIKNKTRAVDADVLAVFELFNNPAKALWPMREMERVAAKVLFDTYGLETLTKRLARIELERQKKDPYFPDPHTPSELLEKMPRIERFLQI